MAELKWRFKHYRHPLTFWGRTMREAVMEFVRCEKRRKERQ